MVAETTEKMTADRPLTPGEVALARSVFGEAIDYDAARVARRKWAFFQPCGTVMAPMGTIHFHPADPNWRDDFAGAPLALQRLFVHEMTHVWQAQVHGRWWLPLMRHPFCRYRYRYDSSRPFDRYGIEQQAELAADFFMMRQGIHRIGLPEQGTFSKLFPFIAA